VAVHYAGNKSKADAIVSGITSSGGRAIAVGGDVAEESDMVAAFEEVEAQFGGVDVVVNTAASCCSARSHPSAWTTWIGCTA
jgi:3-oxoacyl-[acyl-carrier protein] reductase